MLICKYFRLFTYVAPKCIRHLERDTRFIGQLLYIPIYDLLIRLQALLDRFKPFIRFFKSRLGGIRSDFRYDLGIFVCRYSKRQFDPENAEHNGIALFGIITA